MSARPQTLLTFMPMSAADLNAVVEIEQCCYVYPWTIGNFRDSINAGHSCWLARYGDDTIGYAVVLTAANEAHLLNLTIAPQWQSKGYGRSLLLHLISVGVRRFAERLLLEVRPSNVAARRLYQQLGFAAIGVRRNYYPAPVGREDAIVMELKI
jgi:[ribosomal protein S18]-alanine N-acetyltransferase